MIQLAASLSDALIDLIETDDAPIDAIEVGPWYSVGQIRRFQTQRPGWPLYFHAGNVVTAMGLMLWTGRQMKAYSQCTQSPWISCHATLLRPGYISLAMHLGLYIPTPNIASATNRFVRHVAKLARMVDVPIILENMPAPPDRRRRYAFDAEPALIGEILARTNCMLLLDLAHARVAAASMEMHVYDYLCLLPLDKVKQIHVSGPRELGGHLHDVHKSLQAVDYALLDWLLARTQPQLLTLEYFEERVLLREQLERLWTMLGS